MAIHRCHYREFQNGSSFATFSDLRVVATLKMQRHTCDRPLFDRAAGDGRAPTEELPCIRLVGF